MSFQENKSPKIKRNKGKDKLKEKQKKYGKFTSKHVRICLEKPQQINIELN